MKKNYLIFLLIALMAFSPAAVFADAEADGAQADQTAAEALEPVAEEAQLFNGNTACKWNADRTSATDDAGNVATGLFKAPRVGVGISLYYADASGKVVKQEGVVTVSTGEKYIHINETEGEYWTTTGGGALSYLIKNHNGDFFVDWHQGVASAGGYYYYIEANGTVRTAAGFIVNAGKTYFVQQGGVIRTAAGLFKANNGKTYYSEAGGAVRTTQGAIQVGGTKYVIQSDASVATNVGFVRAGGKLFYVSDANGALAVSKAFKVNGKKYHALADGTIAVGGHKWGKKYYFSDDNGVLRTKKGVIKAGGQYYYVKKGGVVATNSKNKYKGKYYISAKSGVIYRGLFKWKKNYYYADSKGKLRTKRGVFTYNGNRYGTKKGGKIYKNASFRVNGKTYRSNKDGTIITGYYKWKGNYYLADSKGAVITKEGIYSYKSKLYYIRSGGVIPTNTFITFRDKYYYAGSGGVIATKNFKYKGYTMHPNSKTGQIPEDDYFKAFPKKNTDPEEVE